MRKLILIFLVILFTMFSVSDEEFDTFDEDMGTGFVIKTTKPKKIITKTLAQEHIFSTFPSSGIGKNSAISMQVNSVAIYSKLKDVNARYITLDLSLKNILKPQKVIVLQGSNHPSQWVAKSSEEYEYKEAIPLYRIPNIMQHLYLRVNNSSERKIDLISLLLDNPLIDFDSNTINILPASIKRGQLAFRFHQGEEIKQLSLHYYDTRYGNIDIPLLGEMKEKAHQVTTLPKQRWEKMSDNFALTVTGYETTEQVQGNEAKKDGQFEIVEVDIESKVYALLQFDPSKRFYLKIGDDHIVKLHPITQALPMGLYRSVSLSPGSNNKFLLAFYVPKGLEEKARSLMVELHGKDIVIPIKKTKSKDNTSQKILASNAIEGTSLEINAVYAYDDKLLIDITFDDDANDSFSTKLSNIFYLNTEAKIPDRNEITEEDIKIMKRQHAGLGNFAVNRAKAKWRESLPSDNKVFGMKKEELILNGTKKRMFVLFDDPFDDTSTAPWYLVTPIFKSLQFKIDKKPPELPDKLKYLLAQTYPYQYHQDSIDKKVLAMVNDFKEKKQKEAKAQQKKEKPLIVTLDKKEKEFITVPPLSASSYGKDIVAKIDSIDGLTAELKKLKWVPSGYGARTAIYSTPAIFTQGWTSENEMFMAVYDQLKEKKYDLKYGSCSLSDEGKRHLKTLAKNIPLSNSIPFVEWIKDNKKHSLVFPFLQSIDKVEKYVANKQYSKTIKHEKATIEMKLTYKPKNDGSTRGMIGGLGNALSGGGSSDFTDIIFKKSWNLNEISDTPIDVFFLSTTAFYNDGNSTQADKAHALSSKKVIPKVLNVTITMPDGQLDTYSCYFKKKQKLQDIFFTFALATPDIPKTALEKMEGKRKLFFKDKNVTKIDPLSRLQWENRAKIYKFIAMQTSYEKRLGRTLQVQAKRNKTPRTIMTMIEKTPDKKLVSSIDLRRVFNDVYGDINAIESFNIMSGILNTEAEAKAVPLGKNVFSYWGDQKDLKVALILPSRKTQFLKKMKEKGVSEDILTRLKKSNKVWIFPINQREHLGWLEIDPKNYRMISVYQNGMYSAMTERAVMEDMENTLRYTLGLLIGTDVSIGTTIGYALKEEDYQILKEKAHMHAKLIACFLKKFQTFNIEEAIKEEAKEQGKAIISGKERGDPLDELMKSLDCDESDLGGGDNAEIPEDYKDYVNFGKGLDDAIARYFN
ncbi:MAG: hypothetical protein P794_02900 [Epsilonproteobacteria bacterium (ex Lamellibrachia satsuma)]|nr:MAG: hypothetical protein P794_02900 [Epsilonproteobacteria bacterium (ex Lamellibrachia satsuma)]